MAYHSDVLVDGEDSLIGSRFMKFRCYQLLHSKHHPVFTSDGYGSAAYICTQEGGLTTPYQTNVACMHSNKRTCCFLLPSWRIQFEKLCHLERTERLRGRTGGQSITVRIVESDLIWSIQYHLTMLWSFIPRKAYPSSNGAHLYKEGESSSCGSQETTKDTRTYTRC
jgi:hypothetical protein